MPVPETAFRFGAAMDPAEIIDFQMKLKEAPKLLEETETISSYTLTLYPEAIALGLQIGSGAYAPINDGENITVWFQVSGGFQTNSAYDGTGVDLAMELTINTSNAPSRKRQRTLILEAKQL